MTLGVIHIKRCSKTVQRIYTREPLQGRSHMNSMHAPSTTPLIALLCFRVRNCKRLLQVVWISRWYFITYSTRSINLGTFKVLQHSFKIFKTEVLKATSFRRWNETAFQNFAIPVSYLKSCLKMSILTHFELCAFKVLLQML